MKDKSVEPGLPDLEFPSDYSGHKIYREKPNHIVHGFLAHIKSTSTPETYPGLFWGRIDRGEEFDTLTEFSVDAKRRPDGNMIPCPRCKVPSKFLEGSLIYIFARQCIAIVGNECASAKAKEDDKRRRNASIEEDYRTNFLLNNLPQVPRLIELSRDLHRIATELEKLHRTLRSGAPGILKQLRAVEKDSGELVVYEQKTIETPTGQTHETIPHRLGRMGASAAIKSAFNCPRDLRLIESRLTPYDGCCDEEKTLSTAIELLTRVPRAIQAVKTIESAERQLSDVRRRMESFVGFFGDRNLKQVAQWAKHPLNLDPFSVESRVFGTGKAVVLKRDASIRSGNEYARIVLSDDLLRFAPVRAHAEMSVRGSARAIVRSTTGRS